MKLVIVESPHKSETIGHFLGSDFKVMASKGHVCDLTSTGKMGLGVDIANGFKPNYKVSPDKAQIVKELKAAVSKADVVYLATDPDREGEAISWHLATILGLDVNTTPRLEFHEITKSAIQKALENPRHIDMNLVESQEARRIIDRLMGYRLSYLLQKKIKSRSAGRVQSVVLKFIVDKEREIQAFVPEEYWTIQGLFENHGVSFNGDLSSINGKAVKISNETEAENIVTSLPKEFKVSSIKSQITKKEPRPPFITSTMQQEAYTQCHFSTKKTSSVAQLLYEGVEIEGTLTGLITYMRTDSTRLADEFVTAANQHILARYGKEYLGHQHMQKSSKNVQDAHEAIRPTDITMTPERVKQYLTRDELALYTLIYDRAVASLMSAKQNKVTTLTLTGDAYEFTASETKNVFPGYYAIYGKYEDKEEASKLPKDINEGDVFSLSNVEKTQHFTKAPSRYTEGKIVKLMDDSKIGRPSTYASTVTTLLTREYVESQKGSFVPTSQGVLTVDRLEEYFPKYMDASYTAAMEESLDSIADGKTDRNRLLTDFWEEFTKYFESAESNMEKLQPKIVEGRVCPKCGKPLVYRKGKYGEFVGCSDYPNCTYIEKEKPDVVSDHVCPECGGQLVKRKGKRGEFVGCSNYPKCTYMEDLQGNPLGKEKKPVEIPSDAPICPQCGVGHLIEKTSRWGKKFIGCSNYPKCHYIQKDENEEDDHKTTYRRYRSKKK
jgi:DNA topoisomerase I